MLLLKTNQWFICYRLQRNAFSIYLPYFTNDLSKQFLVFAGKQLPNGISEQDALSKSTVAIYVYESDLIVRRKHEECKE